MDVQKTAVLVAVLLVLTSCVNRGVDNNGVATEKVSEISFIASEKELNIAVANTNINGIAISVSFYNTAPFETKFEIHDLVYRVVAFKYRPVFLYGQPFDRELANKLLRVGNEVEDGSGCTPTAWAGILPKEQDVGKMCGADDKPRNEENFRKWLISFWDDSKDLLMKQ